MSYCAFCGIMTYPDMIGEVEMPVSYDKLWKTLIDKKMKRSDLKDAAGISFNVLAKMGKNEFVSMESLYKICVALDCGIDEIMEFTNHEHA
nr:helix-turn-helix transcriptional regulator [Flavonifractor plautii]